MIITRRNALIGSAGLILASDLGSSSWLPVALAQTQGPAQGSDKLYDIGFDTYIFGYPALYMQKPAMSHRISAYDPNIRHANQSNVSAAGAAR